MTNNFSKVWASSNRALQCANSFNESKTSGNDRIAFHVGRLGISVDSMKTARNVAAIGLLGYCAYQGSKNYFEIRKAKALSEIKIEEARRLAEIKGTRNLRRETEVVDYEEVTTEAGSTEAPKRRPMTIDELKATVDPKDLEIKYLAGTFIRKGIVNIIAGPSSGGKSHLAMHILYKAAEGRPSGLVDTAVDNVSTGPVKVIAYLAEHDIQDLCDKFCSHPNIRILDKDYCADFKQNSQSILADIQMLIDDMPEGVDCIIDLDNVTALLGQKAMAHDIDILLNGLNAISGKSKMQGKTITFLLVAHTDLDEKGKPDQRWVRGSQNFVNLCPQILYIGKCGYGDPYRMLVPVKTKKGSTERAYIVKFSTGEDPYTLFDYVEEMSLDDAMNLKKKEDFSKGESESTANSCENDAKVGRPSKYSDELIRDIHEAIQNGTSTAEACRTVGGGIDRSSYMERAKKLGLLTD